MVNVAIMDDSGDTNTAKSKFTAWFAKTSSGEPCDDLKRLYAMVESRVPVSIFNLVCQKDAGKTILKPTIRPFAFEAVRIGPKAERLPAKVDALLATNASNVTVVTESPAFQPREGVDYLLRSNIDRLPTSSLGTPGCFRDPGLQSTRLFCFKSITLASWSPKGSTASSPTTPRCSGPTCG